jgi:hypothetical protein
MNLVVASLAAVLAASPLAAEQVSVAEGDWSAIPMVYSRGDLRMSDRSLNQLTEAVALNKCTSVGTEKHMSLSVPFLLEFSPRGEVQQVVVRRIDCPAVEVVLGGALLQLAKSGEYQPTGQNQAGWYRGVFEFTYN